MIVWIILASIILIYWVQYPSIKNDEKNKYNNFFNHVKIPLLVVVIIIIVYIQNSNKCKNQILDVDLGIIKF
jgi:hypothetical protein